MTPVARARLAAWTGSLVSTRSRGWGRVGELAHQPLIWPVATFLAAFALAAVRSPSILGAPFWNEDSMFYAEPWPWAPYMGYLHVIPRIVGGLEHLAGGAFLGNLTALLVVAGVAAYIASEPFAGIIPDWRWRAAAAAFLVVQPAVYELWGSLTYVQWYLGLALVVGLAARPLPLWVAGLASVTGPFSIFTAPFYWLRREWRMAAVLTVGAAVQVAVLLLFPRATNYPLGDIGILGRRLVIEPVFGTMLAAQIPNVFAVPLAVLVALCLARLPWMVLAATGALLAAGLLLNPHEVDMWQPVYAMRYFFIPGYVIGFAGIVSASRRSAAGFLLVALMAVGVVADFGVVRSG